MDTSWMFTKKASELIRKRTDNFVLDEKVLCFVPEWGGHYEHSDCRISPENDYYKLRQEYFFNLILKVLLPRKHNNKYLLQYIITRYVSDDSAPNDILKKEDIKYYELENILNKLHKKTYKNRNKVVSKIKKIESDLETIADVKFNIIGKDAINDYKINNEDLYNLLENKKVNLFLIDYEYFNKSILLDISQNINSELCDNYFIKDCVLQNSFVLAEYFSILLDLKKNYKKQKEFLEYCDSIQFNASHLYMQLNIPGIWKVVQKQKGILHYKNNCEISSNKSSIENVHVFYSLKSLLSWELQQILIQRSRCSSCNEILPVKYRGKYCKKEDNEACYKERNRRRQREFYNKNLTKT